MAIGGQGTSISLPISLEVLQSSVTNLENVLKNLKPESKAFKELERILKSTRAEMDRLQVQASKPFGNQQQFNQTEKTINKIDDALSRAQITISRIDFKDLKLTDDQQKTFDAFEQQLKNIQQGVANFKNELKGELFADVNFTDVLKEIDPQYASRTFDEIIKVVEEKSQAISNTLEKSREKLKKYQATAQIGIDIEAMQSRAANNGSQAEFEKKAMAALGGNIFEKFFTVDKNDILKFKTNGQEQFVEYLQQQFSLNPQQIEELRKKIGAKAILEKIFATDDNQFFIEQLKNAEKANKDYTKEDTNNKQLIQKSTDVIKIQEELAQKTDLVNQKEKESAAETDNVIAALQQFIAMALEATRGEKSYSDSLKTGNTELDSFRTTLAQTNTEFLRLQNQRRVFDSIKTGITNFMGFNQVLNLTKRAISEAANHIKSLDTVMNGIAIVTDMTTADLWNQVDAYSKVAQTYGTSIQGAYEVSKIYYQAGYDTADVMTLMNETLKLSKISGLDYATTTDYMMTAMRGFKLEMEDASRVVDVYSNLAAHTAVSQQELAEAMTRTASSMESVGSTFEETSSMIATMVAVTRESASNIGSAMKSIASRYGELTKNPAGFQDLEGEEYSFNKVDQALQSVGISMKDTNGQFRSFTEVILELSDVWNDLTSVQQRYIATQMAGNRQQSRFLALVSNGDLLRENLENALNSEDVGTLQALEYLDSLQAKIEQVQVAYQQFYTTIGVQDVWKSALGWIRNIIDNLNNLPKVFGKLPVSAGIAIANLISVIKNLLLSGLASFSQNWSQLMKEMEQTGETGGVKTGNKFIDQIVSIIRSRREEVQAATQETLNPDEGKVAEAAGEAADKADKKTTSFWSNFGNKNDALTRGISTLASSLVGLSMAFDQSTESGRNWSGALMGIGGVLQTGIGIVRIAHGDLTAIPQLISGISSIASAIGILHETTEEKVERLTKEAENLSNIAKQAKADERNLSTSIQKVRELEKTRYDSAEAAEQYQAAVEDLADAFPELIVGFDNLGNAVVDVTEITDGGSVAENALAAARKRTAEATYKAAQAETNAAETRLAEAQEKLNNFSVGTAVFNNDSYEDYLSSNESLSTLYKAGYKARFGYEPYALDEGARMTNFVASWENSGLSEILKTVAGGELNERIDQLFESSNNWEELYQAINKWSDESNDAVDRVKQFVNKTQEVVAGPLESYENISKLYILLKQNAFDPLIAEQYEIYKKAVEEYADLELRDSDAAKFIGSIIDFNELKSLVEDVVGADVEYVLSYREQIIGWLQTHSFSSDSVITNVLYKQFEEAKNGNNNIKFEDWIKEQTEIVKIYQEWLNELDPKHSNALNSIIRDNLSKYSFDQIVNILSLKQGDGIYEIFEEYYGSRIDNIQKLLNNKISEVLKEDDPALTKLKNYVENSRNDLSANRQNLINDILERYTKLSDINKTLSESYLDAMLSLLEDIDNEKISSEVANIIFGGDLFSTDGINSIIAELDKQELSTAELVQRLEVIRDSFIENYTLSLTAAASELADSWSDTSKKLSSLRSGIDFVEMQKIIAASDLTENDFYTEDGKNYILNLEKYREYVTKYFEDIKNANNYFKDEELDKIAYLMSRNDLDEIQKTMLSQIGFDINGEGYWNDNGFLSDIGLSALNQAINNHKKARDAFNSALDYATKASINEVEWLAGQYDIGKDELKYGAYKGNNASYKLQISKAHEALNKLITDVVANGLENINFTDYENIGIHHDILSSMQQDIINGISTEEFVRNYAIYLGKTASETASLLIKVMDQQDNASKLVQGITGLKVNSRTDFTSILEAAQKQAGGEELYNQLATSLKEYGATLRDGILDVSQTADIPSIIELIVEFAQQIGLNLEGFMGSYADAIEQGAKDTANLIKSGIKGTLTYANAETLTSTTGIDLTFTKTREGLKLSTEEAYKLYQELKKTSQLQADLVFEDLVKSLKEDIGNEYSNISKVTAAIAELNRQIAQADAADVEQLKERLAYLQKIQSVMLNTPDQFNFMDRSLASGVSGPVNYWNAAGKAYTAMNDAVRTGYIGIQDYTNIVNEMANMARMTGQSMTFLGHTIEADGSGAAELIEAGYSAISNVDGKGAKISLKRMGDEFKIGADGMVDGFEDGLKAMAQEQIKVLDAEIAMLEAIVALEDLDLDTDDNGAFELTDWFEETGNAAGQASKEFQISANKILELAKANDSLNASLNNATFSYKNNNGETLTTTLSDALQLVASGATLGEDFASNFTTAFATYLFSYLGADWDLSTLQSDVESVISGEETEYTVAPTVTYGENSDAGLKDLLEGNNLEKTITVKVTPSEVQQQDVIYSDEAEQRMMETESLGLNYPGAKINNSVKLPGEFVDETEQRLVELESQMLELGLNYPSLAISKEPRGGEEPLNGYNLEEVMADTAELMRIYYEWRNNTVTTPKKVRTPQTPQFDNETLAKRYLSWLLESEDLDIEAVSERSTIDETPKVQEILNNILSKNTRELLTEQKEVKSEALWGKVEEWLNNIWGDEPYSTPTDINTLDNIVSNTEQLTKNSEDYATNLSNASDSSLELEDATEDTSNNASHIEQKFKLVANDADILVNRLRLGETVTYDDLVAAFTSVSANANNALEAVKAIDNYITAHQDLFSFYDPSRIVDTARSNVAYGVNRAKGNVALASGRQTLMGELGPELYVTNGRYFVAGQNGAEFVNLPDDAIVFNHIQTKRLLSGFAGGHGKPVTNEYNAISYAKGNLEGGPALASAQDALAQLKQIRAMWDAMLNASLKDLGQKAGGGSGGGGDKDQKTNAAFIADLERWYNLLRQIAKLEKDINYEETLRNKIQSDRIGNGKAIYASLKREIEALNDEVARNKELSYLQKDYYDRRREDLANSNYGKIFTFNEEGLMQYNDQATMANGDRGGLFALAELNQQNPDGSTKYSAKEQYELLKAWGFSEEMRYDNQGKEIVYDKKSKNADDYYTKAVQAFWDKADGWKDELDSLYDSYNEQLTNVLQNEDKRNKLLQQIIDNQLSVEQKVLKAIEDREQAIIDNLQAERDALQEAANAYIDGLSKQLENEKQMYDNQASDEELIKLRRQLAILQRSGGSASQIASLQEQISEKERNAYFEAQQQQIDAIKEASDLEIERLDVQLDLMKESLEYAKKNGLLWAEVADVMSRSESEISEFIVGNSLEWANKSPLAKSEDLNDLLMEIEQWIEARDDKNNPLSAEATHNWDNYAESAQKRYSKVWTEDNVAKAKAAFAEEYARSSDPNKAGAAADAYFAMQLEDYYAHHPEEDPKRKKSGNDNNGNGDGSGGSGSGGGSKSGTGNQNKNTQKGLLYIRHVERDSMKLLEQEEPKEYPVGTVIKASDYKRNFSSVTYSHASSNSITITSGKQMLILYYIAKRTVAKGIGGGGEKDTQVLRYAGGGLADYTGLAILHGTKTKPEAVLNAEETKMWREDIMSGKPNSLMSLLLDYRDVLANTANENTYNSITRGGESYTFENVSVNMNVGSIANDYDARRAGQNALEEMLNIARKSNVQSIRR